LVYTRLKSIQRQTCLQQAKFGLLIRKQKIHTAW